MVNEDCYKCPFQLKQEVSTKILSTFDKWTTFSVFFQILSEESMVLKVSTHHPWTIRFRSNNSSEFISQFEDDG